MEDTRIQSILLEMRDYNYDSVMCIGRGGLIPGTIIAHELEIKHVLSVSITTYHPDRCEPLWNDRRVLPIKGRRVLIVDDILDTGRTMKFARTLAVQCCVGKIGGFTLHKKPETPIPGGFDKFYFLEETTRWVTYPWETAEGRIALIKESLL